MVTHPRVSQKTSDVNDAELPHLEGIVTFDRHSCHTYCENFPKATNPFVRLQLVNIHQVLIFIVVFSPALVTTIQTWPYPTIIPMG